MRSANLNSCFCNFVPRQVTGHTWQENSRFLFQKKIEVKESQCVALLFDIDNVLRLRFLSDISKIAP
jgi:hypothetical protein